MAASNLRYFNPVSQCRVLYEAILVLNESSVDSFSSPIMPYGENLHENYYTVACTDPSLTFKFAN